MSAPDAKKAKIEMEHEGIGIEILEKKMRRQSFPVMPFSILKVDQESLEVQKYQDQLEELNEKARYLFLIENTGGL